jgi:radical SAM protein with 4Fe4S-binding SPASM domain
MSYLDYQEIIRQVRGKVMQVALGGRGDPNKHQQFGDILKLTRANDIVPNYTTSGLKLTQDEVSLTVEYCGAVAVSWYRSKYTLKALDAFISAGATTNIHYVLSNSSIDEAIDRLKKNNFFGDGTNRINAVVFLIHKPVGLGDQSEVLRAEDPRVHEFFDIVSNWQGNFSIGVDSCSTPGIVNFASSVRMDYLDTCEGARFSAYITPDMIMTPCSFDQSAEYGVSLRDHTIEEAWASDKFKRFRDHLRTSCPSCQNRNECMGGCPLKPEIVLCKKEDRSEN